jgi:cell division septum initiation protein DivIVA
MGQEPGTRGEAVTAPTEPEQIEREIEETREQLGETVEALARKTDVKSQAKRKLEDTKATLSAKAEHVIGKAKETSPEGTSQAAEQLSRTARENPLPLAALGAFAAGVIAGRITKR